MSDSDSSTHQDNSQEAEGALAPALPDIRPVGASAPIQWLKRGWQDFQATRFVGLFYGGIFVLMGYAITWVYATKWQLTMGLIGGFFLIAPFLCAGIYDLSRQLSLGQKPSLQQSLMCWKRNLGAFSMFALILSFSMLVWARLSVIIFALSSTVSFPTLKEVLTQIFSFSNLSFLSIWVCVGFVFASFVFAISVVSTPMILDRRSDTLSAVFSSVRCVITNTRALYLWALLVVVIVGVSMLLGFIPLLVTAPVIGHATWHAYKDMVS